MTAAILFHPEAFSTEGPRLMGRNAAGSSFLRGYFECSQAQQLWVRADTQRHAEIFSELRTGRAQSKLVNFISRENMGALKTPGLLYCSAPTIADLAFERSVFGANAWSLCGITHTTASCRAMDALAALAVGPVEPWDALICTSVAVKANVIKIVTAQTEYLRHRLGSLSVPTPQFPVIPLGINTELFAFSEKDREAARKGLQFSTEAIVILFMGRLSFHAKAHPLAMYQALQNLAVQSSKPIHLVECGWYASDPIKESFAEAANAAMPDVHVTYLDGRNAESRSTAWAAADIFCSLADNLQETFGIAPLEAMAAGLPVVVADWDGYRDTVRDGIDGFCCSTIMPDEGLGGDLAMRHALGIDSYDMYCGLTSSLIAVDHAQVFQAFLRLAKNPDLRKSMGAAGRLRAKSLYDWRVIIPQYEALWKELREIRVSAVIKPEMLRYPWPARMDPYAAYEQYPTHRLSIDTRIALSNTDLRALMKKVKLYRSLKMVAYAHYVIPTESETELVMANLASGPQLAGDAVASISAERRAHVLRGLGWLLKIGVLRLV